MECWDKMMFPVRRVWITLAKRFGIRNRGLSKLRHDVKSCEYEDIHVMWEMLRRTESDQLAPPYNYGYGSGGTVSSSPPEGQRNNKKKNKKSKAAALWKKFPTCPYSLPFVFVSHGRPHHNELQ